MILMPQRTISVFCGLLKPSIGLVCHRRSSREGPPRYGFGKRETIRGIGEIEQVDAA